MMNSAAAHPGRPASDMTDLDAVRQPQAPIAGGDVAGMMDRAVIAQLQADGIIAQSIIANLHVALESARRIGAAIGIIMATKKVTEEQAFQVLNRASQNRHRKLRDVADDVLLAGTIE